MGNVKEVLLEGDFSIELLVPTREPTQGVPLAVELVLETAGLLLLKLNPLGNAVG